jgi:RsiW-degrading membrane proteinase PrsW (M82 family)
MLWKLATPQASLIVGVAVALLLIVLKRYRDEEGKTAPAKIVAAFLFGIGVYTLIVLIIGHFFLDTMMSMIDENFGEPRIAWLFVGLAADGAARLYRLFDP